MAGQFKATQDEFELAYECKGSVRYNAVDPINGCTNAIYLNRKKLTDGYVPHKIRVSITEVE